MGGRYCAINSLLGPRWGQKSLDLRSRDFCPHLEPRGELIAQYRPPMSFRYRIPVMIRIYSNENIYKLNTLLPTLQLSDVVIIASSVSILNADSGGSTHGLSYDSDWLVSRMINFRNEPYLLREYERVFIAKSLRPRRFMPNNSGYIQPYHGQ